MSETAQDFEDADEQEDSWTQQIFKDISNELTEELLKIKERIAENAKVKLTHFAKYNFQELFNEFYPGRARPTSTVRRCGYCGQWISTTLEDFESHVAGHAIQMQSLSSPSSSPRPKPAKPFKCNVVGCSKSFTKKWNLRRHGVIHTEEKPFECSVVGCNKRFTRRRNLRRHGLSHAGEKSFECNVLQKRFTQREGLRKPKHERIHSGVKPFHCSICPKKFSRSDYLNVHLKTHRNRGLVRSSTQPGNLATRVRLDKAEQKRFACEECGKKYTTSSYLTVHRRAHSGERPFKCAQCDKAFYTNTHLTRHLRVHTGERPFSCTMCSRTFTKKLALNAHQKKIHSSVSSPQPQSKSNP